MIIMSILFCFQGISKTVSSFSFQTNSIVTKSKFQWQIMSPNHVCHGKKNFVPKTCNRIYDDKNDHSITSRVGTNTALFSSNDANEGFPVPQNFREAEIIGLRLMQEGRFTDALDGMFFSYLYFV